MKFDTDKRGIAWSKAPIELCWEVVSDWKTMGGMYSTAKIANGTPEIGLGSVRLLVGMSGKPVEEKCNLFWPPYLFGYRVDESTLMSDHQTFIYLQEDRGGTTITWCLVGNHLPNHGKPELLVKDRLMIMDMLPRKVAAICDKLFDERSAKVSA